VVQINYKIIELIKAGTKVSNYP